MELRCFVLRNVPIFSMDPLKILQWCPIFGLSLHLSASLARRLCTKAPHDHLLCWPLAIHLPPGEGQVTHADYTWQMHRSQDVGQSSRFFDLQWLNRPNLNSSTLISFSKKKARSWLTGIKRILIGQASESLLEVAVNIVVVAVSILAGQSSLSFPSPARPL